MGEAEESAGGWGRGSCPLKIQITKPVFRRPCNCSWRRQWHPTPALLPGKSHGRRSLVSCSPWGRKESDTTERLHFHFSLSCIGEGNGNPLQCSCLENPRDRGAWWAAVYGVAQSQTRLKQLSSSSSNCSWRVLLLFAANRIFPFLPRPLRAQGRPHPPRVRGGWGPGNGAQELQLLWASSRLLTVPRVSGGLCSATWAPAGRE